MRLTLAFCAATIQACKGCGVCWRAANATKYKELKSDQTPTASVRPINIDPNAMP